MLQSVAIYACPDCRCSLRIGGSDAGLHCVGCNRTYPIKNGIVYLLPQAISNSKTKLAERDGWERVFRERNWRTAAETIEKLPEGDDTHYWRKVTRAMRFTDDAIGPLEGTTGLDLACGFGWAALRYARRGARMIAADFNDTEFNGLGAAVRAKSLGFDFDAVCCDSECLPLADKSVDFVFICSALHHFTQPVSSLKEIRRVLKPGGRLVDICESFHLARGDGEREASHQDLMDFRGAGINEQSFTQREYEEMFRTAGLRLQTYLLDWDAPTDSIPGPHWELARFDEVIRNYRHPWFRPLLKLLRHTPVMRLQRWRKLHRRIEDRIFIAVK